MKEELLLATFAQAGVALAGYSGIVVTFGQHARGAWSSRERQLLATLIGTSGWSALVSVTPLILRSAEVSEPRIWTLTSAFAIFLVVLRIATRARNALNDLELRAQESMLLAVVFSGEAVCIAILAANVGWLAVSWPLLVAVTWQLAVGFIVFIRLVLPQPPAPPESPNRDAG